MLLLDHFETQPKSSPGYRIEHTVASWPMAQEAEIPGAVVGGTYRLVRPLGGDSGKVYEARHDRLTGRFVIKLLADAEPEAFQRSVQLVSALRHPGVVQVIDYGVAEGQAFVVMEYIDGRPLSELIAEAGIMPADRVARLIDSVAKGLGAAHELGLTHGHLSPQRVFVQRPGTNKEKTKVVGLGLGDEISGVLELTEVTPYTAPEQVGEEAEPRSDQFALAAIAYEMLTGVPPFDDSTERQEPPSIRDYAPDVNVIVDDVIRRALAPEPDGRWPDIMTFAQRLREAGDSSSLEEKTRVSGVPLRPVHVSTTLTPTPVDGLEGLDPPVLVTPNPLDPALITPVEVDLRTPGPRSAVGTLVSRSTTPWQTHLPPPGGSSGFVLPPPSQNALPVLRHPPHSRPTPDAPWTVAPAPGLGIAPDGGGAVMATTAHRAGRRKSASGLLVMGATAALIAFVVVKFDLFGRLAGGTAGVGEAAAGTHPAPGVAPTPPPTPAPPPPAPSEPAIATQAASATAEPAPPAAPAEQAAAGEAAAEPPPEVVQVPAATGQETEPAAVPAADAEPARRHTTTAHRRPKAAALPPELAAEEALLSGGPRVDRRSADKARVKHQAKRPSAGPSASDDPWAE
jgi:serine/threonine protein kinase